MILSLSDSAGAPRWRKSHRHPTRTGWHTRGSPRRARMRPAIFRASFGPRLGFKLSSMP